MVRMTFSTNRAAQAGFACALILMAVAVAAVSVAPPFGAWTRLSPDPIISPAGDTFQAAGTFNPAVIKKDGKFVMLYRAQSHQGVSSLGYAISDDGIHFTRRDEPVLVSEAEYEKGGGVEDPRLQKFGDTYYLTYTGYSNSTGKLADLPLRRLFHIPLRTPEPVHPVV